MQKAKEAKIVKAKAEEEQARRWKEAAAAYEIVRQKEAEQEKILQGIREQARLANEKRIAELEMQEAIRRAGVAAELEDTTARDMAKREEDEREAMELQMERLAKE